MRLRTRPTVCAGGSVLDIAPLSAQACRMLPKLPIADSIYSLPSCEKLHSWRAQFCDQSSSSFDPSVTVPFTPRRKHVHVLPDAVLLELTVYPDATRPPSEDSSLRVSCTLAGCVVHLHRCVGLGSVCHHACNVSDVCAACRITWQSLSATLQERCKAALQAPVALHLWRRWKQLEAAKLWRSPWRGRRAASYGLPSMPLCWSMGRQAYSICGKKDWRCVTFAVAWWPTC